MRLVHLEIIEAASCGGLLDGFKVDLYRPTMKSNEALRPLCLLGPNGSGKSQFLQVVAEIFQAAWHTHKPEEERAEANVGLLFKLAYETSEAEGLNAQRVRISRTSETTPRGAVRMELHDGDDYKVIEDPSSPEYGQHLPSAIVGYTSGDNETLSLPFSVSRSEYAEAVRNAAMPDAAPRTAVPDNRLLLIDYGTHLEVLIANLMIGEPSLRSALIDHAKLDNLSSWRCIIQLNHSGSPNAPRGARSGRKGIQLTEELEQYIDQLKRCATCWDYQEKPEIYTFDFLVDEASREAFKEFWQSPSNLYRSIHKLAMLNDLMIPKTARSRIKRDIEKKHFAARLPEPQEESKVFRFEEVRFNKLNRDGKSEPVDYVSLSDGEHQQAQVFGMFAMMRDPRTLFLLDEPESHFNPQWRVKFISRLTKLPVEGLLNQEIILTSHAPFVASDLTRDHVRIFSKVNGELSATKPGIETFGATFDRILSDCFDVAPPFSQVAREEIERLKSQGSAEEIEDALSNIGSSVERALLADRLISLKDAT
ncbi:putative ATP-binding protein involved in virulence [Phaeobacter sp. CECT 5382]|uniref:restriction system-associated AAA family ATPase n=1 Tax=Phaeobacter sp. CECT 5382 TaxID=1712645 RepID=UPI0006DBC32C|nr:restriction system-associated AAA family ATPase [Phaeobacter sp. CECT 5382]CUH89888.1 putative ATP-binding protein involved in virulence [Phaeobacter sp. CECT 5382]